jgi:hypothetical protein
MQPPGSRNWHLIDPCYTPIQFELKCLKPAYLFYK